MSDLVAGIIACSDSLALAKTVSSVSGHVSKVLISFPPWAPESTLTQGLSSLEIYESGGISAVPWEGNFSDTRNSFASSKHCDADSWVLNLDPGDSVASQDLRLLTRSLDAFASQDLLAIEAEARRYSAPADDRPGGLPGQAPCTGAYPGYESGSSSYTPTRVLCVHRCCSGASWVGAIHESLVVQQQAVKRVQWLVVHKSQVEGGLPDEHYERLLDDRVLSMPDDPSSWLYLGVYQLSKGMRAEAISSLHKSIATGKVPASCMALAKALMSSDEYQQAEPLLSEYLRSYPEDSSAWMALLVCSLKRDNFDGMDYYLGRALKTRSLHKQELARFALYAARKMNYETKVSLYEKILKSLPVN